MDLVLDQLHTLLIQHIQHIHQNEQQEKEQQGNIHKVLVNNVNTKLNIMLLRMDQQILLALHVVSIENIAMDSMEVSTNNTQPIIGFS